MNRQSLGLATPKLKAIHGPEAGREVIHVPRPKREIITDASLILAIERLAAYVYGSDKDVYYYGEGFVKFTLTGEAKAIFDERIQELHNVATVR